MDLGVVAIWRYPVKAMLGELLEAVHTGVGGLAGDRTWVVVDEATGQRIANKRGLTDARLRACRARVESGENEDEQALSVTQPRGHGTPTASGQISSRTTAALRACSLRTA